MFTLHIWIWIIKLIIQLHIFSTMQGIIFQIDNQVVLNLENRVVIAKLFAIYLLWNI